MPRSTRPQPASHPGTLRHYPQRTRRPDTPRRNSLRNPTPSAATRCSHLRSPTRIILPAGPGRGTPSGTAPQRSVAASPATPCAPVAAHRPCPAPNPDRSAPRAEDPPHPDDPHLRSSARSRPRNLTSAPPAARCRSPIARRRPDRTAPPTSCPLPSASLPRAARNHCRPQPLPPANRRRGRTPPPFSAHRAHRHRPATGSGTKSAERTPIRHSAQRWSHSFSSSSC